MATTGLPPAFSWSQGVNQLVGGSVTTPGATSTAAYSPIQGLAQLANTPTGQGQPNVMTQMISALLSAGITPSTGFPQNQQAQAQGSTDPTWSQSSSTTPSLNTPGAPPLDPTMAAIFAQNPPQGS